MDKIRIMIVDDMSEFTVFFSDSLKKYEDIKILSTVSTGKMAVERAMEDKPDVILMDIQMENDYAGIKAGEEILKQLPNVKIIALTVHENSDIVSKAFEAGMIDYILKSSSVDHIVTTIRDCVNDTNFKKINSILASDFSKFKSNQKKIFECYTLLSKISKSEAEIFVSLCKGMNYKEIAKERYVEEVSIRAMVNRITQKTQVHYIKDLIALFNDCDFFNVTEYSVK